jgi:two-component system, NtrC family, sensor kinase
MTATQDDVITELGRVNAELRRERDAALARELALGEVLAVINGSPGNPALVFDAILGKAHSLCGAETGQLVAFDGEYFRVQASNGMPEEFVRRVRRLFRPNNRLQRLIQGDRFIHVPDVRAVELEHDDEVGRGLVEVAGIRTILLVPLRKEDTLLGFISANRREVSPFSESEIGLLESFAAQAVIAMENARLLSELRDRTEELAQRNTSLAEQIDHQAATIDVLKAMSASLGDAHPVFNVIIDRARALCDADAGALVLVKNEMLRLESYRGIDGPLASAYQRLFPRPVDSTTLFGQAILACETKQTADMQAEPGLIGSRFARDAGQRSYVAVPVLRGGAPIGGFGLARARAGGFSVAQLQLLQTFAEQAAIAIGSAETYCALQERTADLQESLEYQTATSDVLKVISRSNPRPRPGVSVGSDDGGAALPRGSCDHLPPSGWRVPMGGGTRTDARVRANRARVPWPPRQR